jgi:hypothetical protein
MFLKNGIRIFSREDLTLKSALSAERKLERFTVLWSKRYGDRIRRLVWALKTSAHPSTAA